MILLEEGGWNLDSVQHYNLDNDNICVQLLISLKTRAKDDREKTYWIYPDEDIQPLLTSNKRTYCISDPQSLLQRTSTQRLGVDPFELRSD